jgi:hypothetical protein
MPKYSFQFGRRAGRLGLPKNHLCKNRHVGFWMEVDGQPAHVLGNPDMDDETRTALVEMGRAAIQAIKDGKIGKQKTDR